MKLLFCKLCGDVIRMIPQVERTCLCGKSKGGYHSDGINAHYSGDNAVPLGFANKSLVEAVKGQPESGQGLRFEAFVIPKECSTLVKLPDDLNARKQ